jgi:hypothetical protein
MSKQEIRVGYEQVNRQEAGGEIASWRIIPCPVQEAGERKLAAHPFFGRAGNFLCLWRRKMTDLRRMQI